MDDVADDGATFRQRYLLAVKARMGSLDTDGGGGRAVQNSVNLYACLVSMRRGKGHKAVFNSLPSLLFQLIFIAGALNPPESVVMSINIA